MTMPKPWRWTSDYNGGWILRDSLGRARANVWANGVWHSWNADGAGGENGSCEGPHGVQNAMDQAMAAIVRQGWTSWKVEYDKKKS